MKEIWKDIPDYEGLYQVSNLGRIKSLKFNHTNYEKILKNSTNQNYPTIILNHNYKPKTFLIHRLVAETFIPNLKKLPCVNHINGIKTDNRVENLEWCTYSENMKHCVETKLYKPTNKKVCQYNLNNVLIKTWDSIKQAAISVNGNSTGIVRCCKNKYYNKTYKGYIWKYPSEYYE